MKPVTRTSGMRSKRNLCQASIRKYTYDLKQLKAWAKAARISTLEGLDIEALRSFRSSWKDGPRSAGKKIERLRAFFRSCHDNGWIEKNLAKLIQVPKVKDSPTLPFTQEEVIRILAASPNEGRVKAARKKLSPVSLGLNIQEVPPKKFAQV